MLLKNFFITLFIISFLVCLQSVAGAESAQQWFEKGEKFRSSQDYKKAIECYDRVLEINPRDALTWYNKGLCFYSLGKYKEAIKCYEETLILDPGDKETIEEKEKAEKALAGQTKVPQANEDISSLDIDRAKELFNEGLVFIDSGNYEEAINCFEKALKINPLYADAWYKKGIAFYNSGKSLEDELSCYNKALEIDNGHAKAWYAKGWALYELGEIEKAKECCSRAKLLAPESSYIWYEGLSQDKSSDED